MPAESRQMRRARERREKFDQVHGAVLKGRTVRDLWLVYGQSRFRETGLTLDDPIVTETLKHAFYAGAASMIELMTRVSPDDISEDQGVEMLQRLHEELETYSKRQR